MYMNIKTDYKIKRQKQFCLFKFCSKIQFRDGEKNVHRCSKTIQLINKWKSFARLLFILPFFPNPLVVAIVERLEPKAEKKFPKVSISSLLRLLEIATERSPARATSSQPERVDKKEENSRQSIQITIIFIWEN